MASINTSTDNVQPSQSPSTEQPQLDDVDYTANTATTPMSQSSITAIHSRTPSSDDPQTQLIFTLRGQIQDLFTQVTQLNSKLVKSYDRVSDLEDDLHITQSNLRQSTLKVSQLELERTQHLSALNTGLLVERSNVVEELTRLMERATQEAAQRSSAESAKRNIETELEDLSKDLFEGANGMVAEARYERFLSEKRAAESERRVREVEEQLDVMQQEMRRLDKGKWVPRAEELVKERTLMSSHVPYQEFLGFVGHLRGLHGQNGQSAPVMNTLLSLPFLTRIATEDSDPTLRLDLAPSLNWLSRRSVLAAIHNGCLVVESMPSSDFLHQLSQRQQRQGSTGFNLNNLSITVSGGSGSTGTSHNTVSCALCGTNIFPVLDPASSSSHLQSAIQPTGTWPTSISLFRKGSSASLRASQTSQGITPPPSPPLPSKAKAVSGVNSSVETTQEQTMPGQVYIFRIISTSASSTSASTTTTNTNMSMNLTAAPFPPPPLHSPVTQAVPTRRGRSGTVSQSPFATKVSKPSSSFQPSFTSQFSSQSSFTQPPSNIPGLNENTGSASSGANTGSNAGTIYPLCTSTWCLTRLRATCEIWAFVKSGVVEKVWEEDVLPLPSPTTHNASSGASSNMSEPPPVHPSQHSHAHTTSTSAPTSAPPIPPRKRGLWGTLESLSERAASWGGSSQSGSRPGTPSTPSTEEKEKKLPVLPAAPPPVHPLIASDKQNPILESGPGTSSGPSAESSTTNAPPPLPKRSEGRVRPSSTSTPHNLGAPAATQSDAQPASDVNADLPRENNEGNTHTGPEEVFPASQHHPSVHSPIPIAIQEPTKLPLPESRPSTPVMSGLTVGSRPGTPSTKPPSRPSTPSTRTEGVPPPLPRRAVTRGPRPMSTRKPSSSPGPLAADVSRTEEVIKEEGERDDVDEKLDENEKVAQDTDAVSNSMQEDGMAEDASVEEKEKEKEKQEGQGQGQEEKIEAAVDGAEDIREHDGTKAKGHDNETETTTTNNDETTPAVNEIEATNASAEVKGISGSSPDSEKRVALLYAAVGDATWEERTWREIVRLKEVMFWARVGGMESS